MPEMSWRLPPASMITGELIARFLGGQRAPDFFAAVFVEGNRSACSHTGKANQFISIDQRVPRESPQRRFDPKSFLKSCDNEPSRSRIQAQEIAFGPRYRLCPH